MGCVKSVLKPCRFFIDTELTHKQHVKPCLLSHCLLNRYEQNTANTGFLGGIAVFSVFEFFFGLVKFRQNW